MTIYNRAWPTPQRVPPPSKSPGDWEAYAQGKGHDFQWHEGWYDKGRLCARCGSYSKETAADEGRDAVDCTGAP